MNQSTALTTSSPANGRGQVAAPIQTFSGNRSQATQVEQARAVAEVQAAVLVAHERPRDTIRAMTQMREVCKIKALAERAFFSFPRAGQTVSGPSVHLARELARCWGNIDYGVKELSRSDARGESEMLAFAWDLESNVRNETTFIVPHARDTKQGVRPLTDMRDIYENNANQGARRLRECIFGVLPKWFTDEAEDICTATLRDGGGVPLVQRITTMIESFQKIGVRKEQIEKRMGKAVDKLDEIDVAQLGVTYRSISKNEISKDEAFPETPAADVDAHLAAKAKTTDPAPTADASKPEATATETSQPVDHAKVATMLIKKIMSAEKPAAVNAVELDYNAELAAMEADAPEQFKKVQDAIDGKRAALKR
jgi:hypothetical protein